MLKWGFVVLACAFVAACGTAEWQQERSVCAARYNSEIPPSYQQIAINKTRAVQVPNGIVNCYTSGSGAMAYTSCTQGTRTEYIPYTEYQMVDANQDRRDGVIRQCAVNACLQKFGNSECKTGK